METLGHRSPEKRIFKLLVRSAAALASSLRDSRPTQGRNVQNAFAKEIFQATVVIRDALQVGVGGFTKINETGHSIIGNHNVGLLNIIMSIARFVQETESISQMILLCSRLVFRTRLKIVQIEPSNVLENFLRRHFIPLHQDTLALLHFRKGHIQGRASAQSLSKLQARRIDALKAFQQVRVDFLILG